MTKAKRTLTRTKKAPGDTNNRVRDEILDGFDEELEMEVDDKRLARLIGKIAEPTDTQDVDRRTYFTELFRLQGELVKLQDWVQAKKLRVVVLFEGRDAAGKGGVIKRITQRLNPGSAAWRRSQRRTSARRRSGTSSATSRTCPPPVRSFCSIAAGTTAPASRA